MYGNNAVVVEDYAAMLNQVEITAKTSHNKFYVLQVLQTNAGKYVFWTAWGRVGSSVDTALLPKDTGKVTTKEEAIKLFCAKFKVHKYTHLHTHTHVRMHAYTHIRTYTHTHIHTYTNTHIHTSHTHIHTYRTRRRMHGPIEAISCSTKTSTILLR